MRSTNMGAALKTAPEDKDKKFIQDNIPSETGTQDVPVKIKKNGKEVTRSAKAKVYATAEDLLTQEFKGDMDLLLATFNQDSVKKAQAVARQACYVFLIGPAKKLYAAAGKLVRDSKAFSNDGTPTIDAEKAFTLAKTMYSSIFTEEELAAVKFDEEKINTGEGEEEPESNE